MGPTSLHPPVLIVGAGPTGLVLALALQRFGVPFRIVDKAAEPGTTSRALVVHARTLEFYRQLGVADAVIDGAQRFEAVNLWVRGVRRGRLPLGDSGKGLSRFPFSLILPQDIHEQILGAALAQRGVAVERGVEVHDLVERDGAVIATLRRSDGGEETCSSAYVVGCDGAHSVVRRKSNIGFPGGTYSHVWYVADVEATGPLTNGEVNISMDDRDIIAVFPMKGDGHARLIGQAPAVAQAEEITWASVNQRMLRELHTDVRKVDWFSTYRVHHRVATTFRRGRVFLAGDAAHLHSPVGGQGMNTGIGDAFNLAWKLASVLSGRAAGTLLDSYEPERIAFARILVATTDRVFATINSDTRFARFVRTEVAPRIMPLVMRSRVGRRAGFRLLSQIAVNYRNGPLSRGNAGAVHGGDRLPWTLTAGDPSGFRDNFAPLSSMNWQVHIYGDAAPDLREACAKHAIALHVFTWQPAMQRAGLTHNALYLIRPDGYVAYAEPQASSAGLDAYLSVAPAHPASRGNAVDCVAS